MGNEASKLKNLEIDKTAVEVNDFWALYNAECPAHSSSNELGGRQLLSIFQGEISVKGQLWLSQGPMERAIKNLMIYRHPYILKYVTTWEEGGQKHLATERVRPLCDILATQSDIQVCLGLRTILCSLIFLVEKAMARHFNICTQSIYVSDNGSWRLAGFEFVWKSKEVNKQLIELARSFRFQAAIDENDRDQMDSIEQFAFATLCEHILEKCSKDESSTPHVQEFRTYCSTHLKHKNPQLRPKLSAVLLHPYFNHEFVLIHSFLFELPLKAVQERQQFFSSLTDRLRYFNEQIVASQLANNLLSRMVLLDATAQLCVTPYVLRTKSEHSAALFSQQIYVEYLLPKILKLFRLRDAQIRLILLEYFMEYVRLLSEEQLKTAILPHLLEGMNDTNEILVAKTLRCMADLVPILGAATVLCGSGPRKRIFADGRPHVVADTTAHWVEPRSITPVMNGSDDILDDDYMVSGSPLPLETEINGSFNSLPQIDDNIEPPVMLLPLRLSPDGGEDNKSAIVTDHNVNKNPTNNNKNEIITTTNQTDNGNNTMGAATSLHTVVDHNDAADDDDEGAWSDWETSDELQRLRAAPTNAQADADDAAQVSTSNELLLLNNIETNSSSSQMTQVTQNSQCESYRTAFSAISSTTTLDSQQSSKSSSGGSYSNKKNIDDLSALDIQVQIAPDSSTGGQANEFDFFKDMEPVISTREAAAAAALASIIPTFKPPEEEIQIDASRFAAAQASNSGDDDADAQDGWGMDEDNDVDGWADTLVRD